ncbi:MAG: hypothetical protein AB1416_08135 [Actinomycetota bacterium]
MTLRPLVPVVLALAAVAAGCGDEPGAPTRPGDEGYVESVQALLSPAGRLAGLVAAQLGPRPAPWPSQPDVSRTLERGDTALASLRALRLSDARVRRQRDRLVRAFTAVRGAMGRVAGDLTRRDRAALRRHAPAFLRGLRRLPSAV